MGLYSFKLEELVRELRSHIKRLDLSLTEVEREIGITRGEFRYRGPVGESAEKKYVKSGRHNKRTTTLQKGEGEKIRDRLKSALMANFGNLPFYDRSNLDASSLVKYRDIGGVVNGNTLSLGHHLSILSDDKHPVVGYNRRANTWTILTTSSEHSIDYYALAGQIAKKHYKRYGFFTSDDTYRDAVNLYGLQDSQKNKAIFANNLYNWSRMNGFKRIYKDFGRYERRVIYYKGKVPRVAPPEIIEDFAGGLKKIKHSLIKSQTDFGDNTIVRVMINLGYKHEPCPYGKKVYFR